MSDTMAGGDSFSSAIYDIETTIPGILKALEAMRVAGAEAIANAMVKMPGLLAIINSFVIEIIEKNFAKVSDMFHINTEAWTKAKARGINTNVRPGESRAVKPSNANVFGAATGHLEEALSGHFRAAGGSHSVLMNGLIESTESFGLHSFYILAAGTEIPLEYQFEVVEGYFYHNYPEILENKSATEAKQHLLNLTPEEMEYVMKMALKEYARMFSFASYLESSLS